MSDRAYGVERQDLDEMRQRLHGPAICKGPGCGLELRLTGQVKINDVPYCPVCAPEIVAKVCADLRARRGPQQPKRVEQRDRLASSYRLPPPPPPVRDPEVPSRTFDRPEADDDLGQLLVQAGLAGELKHLDPRQRRTWSTILAVVRELGECTTDEIRERSGLGYTTVVKHTKAMRDVGLLHQTGWKRPESGMGRSFILYAVAS